MAPPEPRNPFYALLLAFSFLLVVSALALTLLPALEDRARDAGAEVPPSPFRDTLRSDGWRFLVFAAAGVVLFAVASMGLDRLRRLKKERCQGTITSTPTNAPPESS
jgi:hypothetical protein